MRVAVKEISNLKLLLLRDPMPAYHVAAACGMHPTQLSRYAAGKDWPIRHEHLSALCSYFGIDEDKITGWEAFDVFNHEVQGNGHGTH